MKKLFIFLSNCLTICYPAVLAQKPVVNLSFTSEYYNLYVPLDSILIQNLTQGGDTMLYYPDTVLFYDPTIGITENPTTISDGFLVFQNHPNPFAEQTTISIVMPEPDYLQVCVVNLLGQKVAFFEKAMATGIHTFVFYPGNEKQYFFSATAGGLTKAVKMVCLGQNSHQSGLLIYQDSDEIRAGYKSTREIGDFKIYLGDQLRFIGYSKSPLNFVASDVIEDYPEGNENYVFEIIEGLPCPETPTVNYDGHTYTTVQIGTQCWLKENLAFLPNVSPSYDGSGTTPFYYVYDYQGSNVTEAKATGNYQTYGVLYNWPASLTACPPGWSLPSDEEFSNLESFLGGQNIAGNKMKEVGTFHWIGFNYNETNESGFTALPGGQRDFYEYFGYVNYYGYWWSTTEYSSDIAWDRDLGYDYQGVYRGNYDMGYGFSVRCLKDADSSTIPTLTTYIIANISPTSAMSGGEITDDGGAGVIARGVCWSTSQNPTIADSLTTDGAGTGFYLSNLTCLTPGTTYFVRAYATNNIGTAYGDEKNFTTPAVFFNCGDIVNYLGQDYNTISIGDQCWLKENLNVGTMIPSTQNQANNGIIEKYCYDNLGSNCAEYGGLYQWDEMMKYSTQQGVRGICPQYWHLPSEADWFELSGFLGGESIAGGMMKEAGTNHWSAPNTGATNSSGFTGLPGGMRLSSGGFDGQSSYGSWWSSREHSSLYAWNRTLAYNYEHLSISYGGARFYGFSVRCLKD